jgi:hypothetical protein
MERFGDLLLVSPPPVFSRRFLPLVVDLRRLLLFADVNLGSHLMHKFKVSVHVMNDSDLEELTPDVIR